MAKTKKPKKPKKKAKKKAKTRTTTKRKSSRTKFEPRLPFLNNILFGGPVFTRVKQMLRRR